MYTQNHNEKNYNTRIDRAQKLIVRHRVRIYNTYVEASREALAFHLI